MRFLAVVATAMCLTVAPVAQTVCAQPLSPGKPAGVHQARHGARTGLLIAGGALVVGLVAVLAFRGNGDSNKGLVIPTNTGTNP
jgi:hypothetical protein